MFPVYCPVFLLNHSDWSHSVFNVFKTQQISQTVSHEILSEGEALQLGSCLSVGNIRQFSYLYRHTKDHIYQREVMYSMLPNRGDSKKAYK